MELWIRSQDREDLVKVDNIRLWDENTLAVNFNNSGVDLQYLVVGEYETRERSLEVLDEIQEYLCFDKFNYEDKDKTCYQDCGCYNSDIIMVYEMPKD